MQRHVGVNVTASSRKLTLLQHAGLPTLAQAALLAFAAHVHVHFAAAVVLAGVLGAFNDAAAEEAFAAFAAEHVVVETRRLVPTHAAHLVPQHLRSWALLPLHRLTVYTHITRPDSTFKVQTFRVPVASAGFAPVFPSIKFQACDSD